MTRAVRCGTHGLIKRCAACEATRVPTGSYPTLDVPRGTIEWLREAARVWTAMGDEGAVAFVLWVSVDLRESAA